MSGVIKSERNCRALEVRFAVEARVEFLRRGAPLVLFLFARRMSDENLIGGS